MGRRRGPDEALALLKAGNARFAAGTCEHPNVSAGRRKETADHGQHPVAVVLACSDSRVPVERVFDRGIGDLFVVRVAGNVCSTDEIGSIEYAAEHLGTPLLVVLGHTGCGVVTSVVLDQRLPGSIPRLVDNVRMAVLAAEREHPDLAGPALVPEAVKANVWQAIDDLFVRSPICCERVTAGELQVVGAIYDLAAGTVEWLGPHPEQARLLA